MLDGVRRIALRDEPLGDVGVAVAVLAGAVGDDDDGARLPIRPPRLPEDPPAPGPGEVLRNVCHCSAQGTITASSCGESRATTYSAGSVSDTFSSTCVSRGGT